MTARDPRGLGAPQSALANTLRGFARWVWQHLWRFYAVRDNVVLGHNVHIGIGSIVSAPRGLRIHDGVYIGKFCTVQCDGSIGRDTMIANNVGLVGRYDHDHRQLGTPIRKAAWIGDPDYSGAGRGLQVVVEEDVWIGFGAIILTGVTIGRGAIVGAGSVVIRNVANYAVVAGNPAREVGRRFTKEEIVAHEAAMAPFAS